MIAIIATTFFAAVVNGALGYGFSSLAVPLALLVVSNRVLNPAIVLLEVVLNAHVLWNNRAALTHVWKRVLGVMVGLLPGVALGTSVLTHVDPSWLKLAIFTGLLPLILLQTAGYRRRVRAERIAGVVLGGAVGTIYAVTTISGPPLAMFLTNQGYANTDFRVALGAIRLVASVLTAALYARSSLYSRESLSLLIAILPAVILGVPAGAWLIRRTQEETFRRLCMSFDAVIVAFGVSTLLHALHIVDGTAAYLPCAAVVAFDVIVLVRFFRTPLEGPSPHSGLAAP
ncbi:MAG: sulfite exporter TauE/SafE family protein [Gemmatimonadaceae bacterium]